jgi:hypothetical protein
MRYPSFIILFLVFLTCCVKETYWGKSDFKQILYFSVTGQSGNSQIKQDSLIIRITVSSATDITKLQPDSIRLSTYARIEPGKSVSRDFSTPQKYSVFAENGSSAEYTIYINKEGDNPQLENSTLDNWYTLPGKSYEEPGLDANSIWATGNAGVVTLGPANTIPVILSGSDKYAKLITLDLGALASVTGQQMAAATLFTGKFVLNISDPLSSPQFGIPFTSKPIAMELDYSYLPGSPFKDGKGRVLAKQDSCDIYILLENRSGTDIKRIGTGWFRSPETISSFTKLNVPITYGPMPSNAPSYTLPANGMFGNAADPVTHLTIVYASSARGNFYEGGVNSTLQVNNVRLIY